MAAGACQDESSVWVDAVEEEPVSLNVQLTVGGEVARELVVAMLFKPVLPTFGDRSDGDLERIHVVVLAFESFYVA